MPTDIRRFTGPDVSVPYSRYVPGKSKTHDQLRANLLNSEGKRADGRALHQSRPLSVVRTGVVTQAKGSAYVEVGDTKVICSVFPPREIPNRNEFSRLGQLHCEVKFAMFSCARQRRAAAPEPDERQLSSALRQALQPAVMRDAFPNYQVDVVALVLENGGGCLAAAVTAAGLALVDAAMPVRGLVSAATLAVLGDHVFMDPTEAEESACQDNIDDVGVNHGVVMLAYMPAHDHICDFTQIGSMDTECLTSTIDVLRNECIEKIVPEIESCLLKSVQVAIRLKEKEKESGREREESLKKSVNEMRRKLNML